jgi:hypothetical protein
VLNQERRIVKQDQFETKLERFVINHYDGIGKTIAAVFLAGMTVCLLFGNSTILGSFTALMIGFAIALMILVGAPDRRRMKSWQHDQARRDDEKWEQKFVPAIK